MSSHGETKSTRADKSSVLTLQDLWEERKEGGRDDKAGQTEKGNRIVEYVREGLSICLSGFSSHQA